MDKQAAVKIIRDTFERPFNKGQYVNFIKNLFNSIDDSKNFIYRGNFIPDAFKPYIYTLERIGKYTDAEDNKIDILIAHLKKETSLERARTMQRNFIAWYLSGSRGGDLKDAAIVAFHTDDLEDWRFSLVKMEYKLTQTKSGRPKGKEELTPARRYSFLVGKNEPNHTAKQQLIPLLQDDINNPTLAQLEDAFNIETVTEEFFKNYRDMFIRVKEAMDDIVKKYPAVRKDFADKGIDTVDFAKKLMGQIVFLYFLQKKGWFGVEKGKDWGTGSKRFLRNLHSGKIIQYKNFFNDILEPLFYDALARDRSDIDHYNEHFKTKIPFLNGGLFDPINNYDWVNTDILLPDELFSNDKKTKQGDKGDGILDTFDRYNFTVREDEPLEKEVAIDPELLGKAYEKFNAIRADNFDEYKKALRNGQKGAESKFNKQYGVYYTPREIVHYMCQQSLINYLVTEFSSVIPSEARNLKETIEFLILQGEKYIEYFKTAKEKIDEGKKSERYKETEYFIELKKHSTEIDNLLSNIKVCDPAIGSGAFPVGMMTEIIKARLFFSETKCLNDSYKNIQGDELKRNAYNYKRDCIQNSLYGVDIDPGAVEIAKLRLWLSLVVDEEDIKTIKPLPNLDYKIMQGNSLIEEYEGIKLIDEHFFEKEVPYEISLKEEQSKLQKEYIELHNQDKLTKEKKEEIEKKLKDIEKYLKKSDVSQKDDKNLDLFGMSKAKKEAEKLLELQKQFFSTFHKTEKDKLKKEIELLTWDLIEETLKEQNKEDKIKEIAQFKKTNTYPFFLWKLHFADIFQHKGGFDIVIANPPYISAVTMARNDSQKEYFKKIYPLATGAYDIYILFLLKAMELLNKIGVYSWIIPNKFLIADYAEKCKELLIKKNGLINSIDVSNFKVFEETGVYPIIIIGRKGYNKEYKELLIEKYEDLEFRLFKEIKKLKHHKTFKEFNIKLYSGTTGFQARQIIPFIKDKQNKNSIPFIVSGNVNRYFWSNKNVRYMGNFYDFAFIEKNNIVSNSKWQFWNKPKIIISGMTKVIEAVYSLEPIGLGVGIYGIYDFGRFEPKCLTGLLNSKYFTFYLRKKFKDKHLAGGYLGINKSTIEKLPLVDINKTEQVKISEIVDKIISINKDDDYFDNSDKRAKVKEYEHQIDQMGYKLYGLTKEEIRIVERTVK